MAHDEAAHVITVTGEPRRALISRALGRRQGKSERRRTAVRFRDLPLFLKLLIPFLALMLLFGALGGFLIVRDLSSRAQASLDRDLSRLSLDASSFVHDRELYLLESANFAANLQGMPEAIREGDPVAVARLLQSVRALKTDLTLLAVTGKNGSGLVEFIETSAGTTRRGGGTAWASNSFVGHSLRDLSGTRSSGFLTVGRRTILAIAAPVCTSSPVCSPVGAAIVGIGAEEIASGALGRPTRGGLASPPPVGVGIYDAERKLLASSGLSGLRAQAPRLPSDRPVRLTEQAGSQEIAALYVPLELQARRVGVLGVGTPSAPAFASTRQAGIRLAGILLATMAGVVGLGALLSRFILAQVKPLVETSRALGRGDLAARATVMGNDELGELALGVNDMAEQLQASRETLELRVAQRTEEVQRLLQERTDFFASMSHEFRTPLAVILGNAEMLLDPESPKSGAWKKETTRTIVDSSEHLLALVNDIVDLARAEGGKIELELEDVRLPQLVNEMRATIEGLARTGDLAVSTDVPRDLPVVPADRTRLREIILNLVDNAVKYTSAGGRIAISATARSGCVEVSIADTGSGIPSMIGERIFEPFYRVKGTKAQRGQASSGLGLALTKRLVEAHGGDISFTSRPSAGTKFTFTLPTTRVVRATKQSGKK